MSLLDNNPADRRALAVEASALTRRFGSLVGVNELQLRIARQSIFGLLGPNGAGKTTTIKMLTTMLAPSAGSARIVGFDIVHDAVEVRRRIGYVSQMLSADGGLTGYENLLLFARLYRIPRQERRRRILDALRFMGLSEAERASAAVRVGCDPRLESGSSRPRTAPAHVRADSNTSPRCLPVFRRTRGRC